MQRHLNFPFQNDERMGDTSPVTTCKSHWNAHAQTNLNHRFSAIHAHNMEKKNPSSMLYCYLMKASGSLNLISVTPEQFKKF